MTLQYRTRNMSEDRRWRERIRLSERLIINLVDCWCCENSEFPFSQAVAGILYLFSPRCPALDSPEVEILEGVFERIGTPQEEYRQTWPQRPEARGSELIASLSQILEDAVRQWSDVSMRAPTIESVAQQAADAISVQQYVIFHHCQTTRRDFGGFYSNG